MNPQLIEKMGAAMADVYADVTDRILVNLARHFKLIAAGKPVPGSWDYQVKKLAEMGQVTRETEAIILESLGDADATLAGMLETAVRDGLRGVDRPLRQAAERGLLHGSGFLAPEIAPNQTKAYLSYYAQSADKLNLVNTVMLESTEQAYRGTVADIASRIDRTQGILNTAAGEIITGAESFNKVQRDAVRKMVDNGLTGFIDHGGHRWSPEAYVAMDMRSTMANTAREAVWEQSEAAGCDLYQVSHHDGARPLCYPWQGKVISRSGWRGEVTDGDGNTVTVHSEDEIESFNYGGGLFGVNCGHYPIPFIPGFSRIRPPEQSEEENAKEYEESQKQRQLERKYREEKRDLEVMKAQGAPEDEIRAQRAKVKAANDNLDGFCEETGRARRSGREYRPIKADWSNATRPEMERTIHEGEYPFLPSTKNSVTEAYITSDEYADRFNGVTGNEKVDSAIADSAREMLLHRSGTDFEDLALIDADTGELVHTLRTSDVKHGMKYDDETKEKIESAKQKGRRIIAVHNHPNNYPPSMDDGSSAREHGYIGGVAVCHDGHIYTYSPTDEVYSTEDCKAIHQLIDADVIQSFDLDKIWFTYLKEFGMIITERG